MHRSFLLLLLFGWLAAGPASPSALAQHDAGQLFPHILEDQKRFWLFPARADSWKEPRLLVLAGISAGSLALDGQASQELRSSQKLAGFSDLLDSPGTDIVLHAAPLAVLAAGALSQRQELTDLGWKSTEAAIDAILVSNLLKLATQRARPHTGKRFGFGEGGNAFPSGHSTLAWALAATAARHFETRKWVPWVVFPAAAVVSFSRVSSGHHFASDAVVGSLLGFSIGYWIVR